MNRKQFQEWLEQFPEETIIEVAIQNIKKGYLDFGEVVFEKFLGQDECADYIFYDFGESLECNPYQSKYILQIGRGL